MSVFTPRFLECRDLGHAWEQAGDVVRHSSPNNIRSFTRVLRCTRCSTERRDEYRVGNNVVQPRKKGYRYPTGYQVRGGLSRGEARMLLFYPRNEQNVAPIRQEAS